MKENRKYWYFLFSTRKYTLVFSIQEQVQKAYWPDAAACVWCSDLHLLLGQVQMRNSLAITFYSCSESLS